MTDNQNEVHHHEDIVCGNDELMPWQREIFQDWLTSPSNTLAILGRGLGARRILEEAFGLYASPSQLVVLLNVSQDYIEGIRRKWSMGEESLLPHLLIKWVDAGTVKRQEAYAGGGILAMTCRVLLTDLLCNRVPIDRLKGCLVADAHLVLPDSTEAFVLHLLREQTSNYSPRQSGAFWIRAVSDVPQAFASGWAKADKALQHLQCKEMRLWPRTHPAINAGLTTTVKPETEGKGSNLL